MNATLMHSATELAKMIAKAKISAVELLGLHFDRVDQLNPSINAVIWQDRDAAMAEAKACDAEQSMGKARRPLHGVPVTAKESFDLAGGPSTWGLPEWKNNIPDSDSDAVARYRAAGAIVYGKTNVPLKLAEWQTFNDLYGTTSNPWDLSRTPGGSSGGAAAACHRHVRA